MSSTPQRKLLVEGDAEKRLIPHLIESQGIPWGDSRDDWIVTIESYDGVANLLKSGFLEVQSKTRNLESLGVVVDANDDFEARWRSLKVRCEKIVPQLTDDFPSEGLVVESDSGLRFGVWIMPDNHSSGMLETFLAYLVPDGDRNPLFAYAKDVVVVEAKTKGAPYNDLHTDKAVIHSWLAWQDPPGRQLHNAVIERILDPQSPECGPFVDWFKRTFAIPDED